MKPVWGHRVGKHEEVNVEGNSRRDFLKKAGVAAWTVPAVQVVNMTGALAGEVNVSVVTTTTPPTTRPPDCREVYFRLKAEPSGRGWVWTKGEGRNDCITGGDWEALVPDGLPISIEGDEEKVVVKHEIPDCYIVRAAHKAGSPRQGTACFAAEINDKKDEPGGYAIFTAQDKGISHVELIVCCCIAV